MNLLHRSKHYSTPLSVLPRTFHPLLSQQQPIRASSSSSSGSSSHKPRGATPQSRPRDEQITAPLVRLASADVGLPVQPPSAILAQLNRETSYLVQVAGPTDGGRSPSPAIVKIVSKEEERAYEQGKQQQQHDVVRAKTSTKQLEVRWGIDAHDLQHKMKRLRTFLMEGRRVEVLLGGSKKRGKVVGVEERATLVGEVKRVVEGCEGAKEWKAMDMGPDRGILFFEGKRVEKVDGEEVLKKEEKRGKREKRERKERGEKGEREYELQKKNHSAQKV